MRKMRRKLILFSLILIFIYLGMISAEIMFSQPSILYNLGDSLNISATIKMGVEAANFFELYLNCENESYNFYKVPLTLKSGEEKKLETSLPLAKSLVSQPNNYCFIKAYYLYETENSQKFLVSDKINVSISLNNLSIEPGKKILVSGTAVKENGKTAEGFVEIYMENSDVKSKGNVIGGKFSAEFVDCGNCQNCKSSRKDCAADGIEVKQKKRGSHKIIVGWPQIEISNLIVGADFWPKKREVAI